MRDAADLEGGPQDDHGMASPQDSGDAFITAMPYQRIYPTLPSDTGEKEQTSLNRHKEGTELFITPSVRVDSPEGTKQVSSNSSTTAESMSSNMFVTAVPPENIEDGTNSQLNSHFETALQPLDTAGAVASELTRRSLVDAKETLDSILSPTVPVNYALQQLSEGKKDRATIRKELAEMCSEKVESSSQDREFVSAQPQIPSEGAQLALHIFSRESQSHQGENEGKLGKRRVQFEMPAPSVAKRYCPGSERSKLSSSGSGMTSTPSTIHPVTSQLHMAGLKKQSQSWFSKLFRNK